LNAFRRRAYGSIFAAPFLFACASPRMVPPPEIAQGSQILDAQNRSSATGLFVDESFDLGTYKVSKVDRKMTTNSSLSVNSFASNKTKTGYSFAFGGGQGSWKGTCTYASDQKNLSILGGEASYSQGGLVCECSDGSRTSRAEIGRQGEKLTGSLSAGGESYTLSPVFDTEPKMAGGMVAGYRFDAADGPRAAVEVLHPGRVWLGQKLPESEREPSICAMAGLMLFVEPSEK
jgi:hypothetical protein